jgi:hypothetical protein
MERRRRRWDRGKTGTITSGLEKSAGLKTRHYKERARCRAEAWRYNDKKARLAGRVRAREHAAVEGEGLAGDEGRAVGAKPDDGFGDFGRIAEATDRMQTEKPLLHFG